MMRLRQLYLLLWVCILIPVFGFSESVITGGSTIGTEVEFSQESEHIATPALFAQGALDFFLPVNTNWSVFTNGGGKISFLPLTTEVSGQAYLSGDVSYRGNVFFGKLTLSSYLEHSTLQSVPDWFQYAELALSLDYQNVSVFVTPQFFWEVENNLHTFGIESEIGSSIGFTQMVLTPKIIAGYQWLPYADTKVYISPTVDLSWYPALPLNATLSIGARLTESSEKSEIIEGGEMVPIGSGSAFFWNLKTSLFLAQWLDMEIALPGTYMVKKYGHIEEYQHQLEAEYQFYFQPEITCTVTILPFLRIAVNGGINLLRSNSTYRNSFFGYVGVAADLSF